MSKTALGAIALLVGLAGGTLVGGSLIGGAAAGVGAGVGLSAGICSTVQAAEELEYLTAEQVDEVLSQAAMDLSGKTELADGETIVGSSAACTDVIARLQKTAS